jgi:hypothetical protein
VIHKGEKFLCNLLWSHPSKDLMGLVDRAKRWDTQMVVSWCGEEEGQCVKPMQIKKSKDSETQQQKQWEGKSTAFQLFTSFMVQSYQSISFYIKTVLQFFKQKIGINNWSHQTANDKLMSLSQTYRALKSKTYCSYHNNIMGSFTNTNLIRTVKFITTTITI